MNKYKLIGLKNHRDSILGSIDYFKSSLKICKKSRDQFTFKSHLCDAQIRLSEFYTVLQICGIKL